MTVCSASFHLLLLEFDIPELRQQLIHWSLKYQGVERPSLKYQGVERLWIRIDCGMTSPTLCLMLYGFKSAVNRWLPPCVMVSSVFRGAGACRVVKAIY